MLGMIPLKMEKKRLKNDYKRQEREQETLRCYNNAPEAVRMVVDKLRKIRGMEVECNYFSRGYEIRVEMKNPEFGGKRLSCKKIIPGYHIKEVRHDYLAITVANEIKQEFSDAILEFFGLKDVEEEGC